MIEMPTPEQELFPEYKDKIEEIRNIYSALIDKAMEAEEPYNPAVKFKKFLQEKFSLVGIQVPVEKFGAYHYAVGSTPRGDTIAEIVPKFDTDDELVLNSLREFAETI